MKKTLVVALSVLALSACSMKPAAPSGDSGWESIGNSVTKRCDGTTLVYAADKASSSGHALALVLDSPECGGDSPALPN